MTGPAALLAAVLAAACGVQGPTRPPRLEHPQAVRDLAVTESGLALELSFTLPTLATDGQQLTKPLEVEILRSVTPPGSPPPTTREPSPPWKLLRGPELARSVKEGKVKISLPLNGGEFRLQLGATFAFQVRTLTRGFRGRAIESPPSNVVRQTLIDVSSVPQNLSIEPTEKALILTWAAPTKTLTGKPVSNLTGYSIELSRTGKSGSFEPAGQVTAPPYRFSPFQFGQLYSFAVRALFSSRGAAAQSAPSQPAAIVPRDVFPPAVPRGLSAIYAAGGVELIWQPNTEPDLAGYRVYRREENTGFTLLNSRPLKTPVFRDTSVAPGKKYFYAVTALDLSGNESAKSNPVAVETSPSPML